MGESALYKTKQPVRAGIDPKDLRIGNLVDYCGQIVVVKNISEYGVNKEDVTDGYHDSESGAYRILRYENISPIPLTEEILLRAGFEKWSNHSFSMTVGEFENELEYRIDDKELAIWGSDGCTEGHNFRAKAEFLHQLQNLYFALTRKELEIKLS